MTKFWGILFGVVMLAALLLFVVAPFVPGWWLPMNVASYGGEVDLLFYVILFITGFFFVLTEAILVYNMLKFPARDGEKSEYIHTHHRLEVLWTLVPGVILFLLAIVQVPPWAHIKFQRNMPDVDASTTQQLEVIAHQWQWTFRYPSPQRMDQPQDDFRTPHIDDLFVENELHIVKGFHVLTYLRTRDVLHSFFLPNLRIKQDALPGKTIPVWFNSLESNTRREEESTEEATPPAGGHWFLQRQEKGRYHWVRWVDGYPSTGERDSNYIWEVACAEFCGTRHSLMRGKLYVHKDRGDFLAWLKLVQAAQQQRTVDPTPSEK